MKTYAEKRNKQPFDWFEFLNRKDISEKEWKEADKRAGSWVTCACGNQCSVIPRDDKGVPKDSILDELGLNFSWAIYDRNKRKAISKLKQIEKRSAFLIDKIVKNAQEIINAAK